MNEDIWTNVFEAIDYYTQHVFCVMCKRQRCPMSQMVNIRTRGTITLGLNVCPSCADSLRKPDGSISMFKLQKWMWKSGRR